MAYGRRALPNAHRSRLRRCRSRSRAAMLPAKRRPEPARRPRSSWRCIRRCSRLPHPERRQSMLFSATLSHRVLELAYEHLNNPELVRIEPDKMTVDEVRQLMYYPSMEEKVPLLIGLLHQAEAVRTLVFVNTKRTAERLESTLKANGFNAQALSGDVPQNKRLRFLRDFHDGKRAVL